MKKRELVNLGLTSPEAIAAAIAACRQHRLGRDQARQSLIRLINDPAAMADDPTWGAVAAALISHPDQYAQSVEAPLRLWGKVGEDFDRAAFDQIARACELPIAAAGALMPDAHVGYGLPIGGVLATRNAVIPYAVGVDIACRVKLSVFDLPPSMLETDSGRERLTHAIESETRFGVGAEFGSRSDRTPRREHAVLDDDWAVSPVTLRLKPKAHAQLGTSGSGNHFVEFGVLSIAEDSTDLPLPAGEYLALLSHSGSRGCGAAVCDHYSRLAMEQHAKLDPQYRQLAWLDLDSHAGKEYWNAMQLMGEYAAANHACIHAHIAKHIGAETLLGVENHHNFAWEEEHIFNGSIERVIVHRKGATPAGAGVLGVIPGTMADPAFVVVGKDGSGSLASASHGAGRVMSRTAARKSFNWKAVKPMLAERRVTLISAGIDENPHVYKDIRRVLSLQHDLVRPIARFDPRLVKMAPEGEKAED
ncbi:MAG: RtcB family protein [Phycisphaeraceae bacterium]|nr:RtcB family protein [Phycisphaeraceae bacterium]MCW5762702.1 RtcB family protein [Phycisphaeraceae bacterium]